MKLAITLIRRKVEDEEGERGDDDARNDQIDDVITRLASNYEERGNVGVARVCEE